jgi:hypothetical protein
MAGYTLSLFYLLLIASTGLSLEADQAGKNPEMVPMTILTIRPVSTFLDVKNTLNSAEYCIIKVNT